MLLYSIASLEELNYVRIGFEVVSKVEMEEIVCAGCAGWGDSGLVTLTLVPRGEKWGIEEMEELKEKAYGLGVHLEFVWK